MVLMCAFIYWLLNCKVIVRNLSTSLLLVRITRNGWSMSYTLLLSMDFVCTALSNWGKDYIEGENLYKQLHSTWMTLVTLDTIALVNLQWVNFISSALEFQGYIVDCLLPLHLGVHNNIGFGYLPLQADPNLWYLIHKSSLYRCSHNCTI